MTAGNLGRSAADQIGFKPARTNNREQQLAAMPEPRIATFARSVMLL